MRTGWSFICIAAALACVAAQPIAAKELAKSDGLVIDDAWARATPPGAPSAAAYIIINNPRGAADRLTDVRSAIAASASLHRTQMEDGIARMAPLERGISLPPRTELMMVPGGIHIMLTGLTWRLEPGSTFPLTLTFADGREVSIEVPVKEIGAQAPDHHHEER